MSIVKISNKKSLEQLQAKLPLRLGRKPTQQDTLDYCLILANQNFEEIIQRGIQSGCFRHMDATLTANSIVFLLALVPMRGWNFMKNYKERDVMEFTRNFIKNGILENET